MWKSRDLALAIILAGTSFVYSASTVQLTSVITGIPGVGYIFTIGTVTIFGIAFLLFEGRRWRFFVMTILYNMLLTSVLVNRGSFHIFRIIPALTATFIQDALFNSVYGFFEKRKKLKWLSILLGFEGLTVDAFMRILMYPFLMPPEYTSTYFSVTLMMLPVILLNGVLGGYFAFKIYERIRKPERSSTPNSDMTYKRKYVSLGPLVDTR